ncbi:transposase domain-containing protein [Constrictibacter sp. MBR-5]|uniref:transposase domain-containing protein n=1 Tax=Constrictibacter sp. MBR-5 TaxID=3156467 RepID=UPI003395E2CE
MVANCKLNGADPVAYIPHTLTGIIDGHSQSPIDDLMPGSSLRTKIMGSIGMLPTRYGDGLASPFISRRSLPATRSG